LSNTVSAVGNGRDLIVRIRMGAAFCGASTAQPPGGANGMVGGSPGGVGNFQPSVCTRGTNRACARTHGGSSSNRASRTGTSMAHASRSAATAGPGKVKSIATMSGTSHESGSAGGTLRHPHLASFGDRFADADERLGRVQPCARSIQHVRDERHVNDKIGMRPSCIG
jgi:hypothetical protein